MHAEAFNTHQTHQTSAQALDKQTNRTRKGLQGAILNILTLAIERGVHDMTTKEISRAYEKNSANGQRYDASSFTKPVSDLLAAKLIERLPSDRKCLISNQSAAPVRLVLESRK